MFDPHENQYGSERFGAWTANPRILQSTDALTATGSSAVIQSKAVVIAREKQL
jgi:hypothetical protein